MLPASANYCIRCGRAVSAQAELQPRLQKYISQELLERLQEAPEDGSLVGERRVVTMLFCDVKGSTAMAERLDPEEWAEIMNGAFGYLIPPILRYDGTIPRMMGDAVLAFFGAPSAHEDDPERAVRAGLEIVDGIQIYRQKLKQERGLDFDVRVGINTGLVVVGSVGTQQRWEYTAMGDAINLAARMEQTARPGTVQISEFTYRLIASLVEVEPLGAIEVKGKEARVNAYRVLGFRTGNEPIYLAEAQQPLVGRVPEMAALRDAVFRVTSGQGQIVSLVGEAGLGKTRLIEALQHETARHAGTEPDVSWMHIRSAAYASSRPYEQFRQHVQAESGIKETDSAAQVEHKLTHFLRYYDPELRSRAVRIYSLLFGGDDPDSGNTVLQGESFKRELFEIVYRLLEIRFKNQPSVIVFDDLQWVDAGSAELIVHLFQLVKETPVLFLCASRPEEQSPAVYVLEHARSNYSTAYKEINLAPLGETEGGELIDSLLHSRFPGASLSQELRAQILQKAEGNPLYIREVVQSLLESGMLLQDRKARVEEDHLRIPDSLHALLVSRMDHLSEPGRRTLQVASVIGRSFSAQVLERVLDEEVDLPAQMETFQRLNLIVPLNGDGQEYRFRHALAHEAAYRSIITRQRKAYHRKVGEVFEAIAGRRPESQAALVAYHYEMAGDERAYHFYRLAAAQAVRFFAHADALKYFNKALPYARDLPGDLLKIHEGRAQVYFFQGLFAQARADYEQALELARQLGYEADETRLLAYLAWLLWSSGQGEQSIALAREAEEKARALGDPLLAIRAAIVLSSALQNAGELIPAQKRLQTVLVHSRTQPESQSLQAECLHFLAMQDNFMGLFWRAAARARRGVELARQTGNRRISIVLNYILSLAEGGRGNYDQALADLEAGKRAADEIDSPWAARHINQLGWLHAELGDWETAYAIDLSGLEPTRALTGFKEIEISTQINLALDCIGLGRLDEALAYIHACEESLGLTEYGVHDWRWRTRLADARARLHLSTGQLAEAQQGVEELFQIAGRTRARKYLQRGHMLQAGLYIAGGDAEKARVELEAALRLADAMCYPPGRIQARQQLSALLVQNGDDQWSEALQREAQEIAASIDRRLKNKTLRRSFLRGIGSGSFH